VPGHPLYYNIYVEATVAGLQGAEVGGPGSTDYWNIQEWVLS
jgi:hypothetical protein